MNDKLSVAVLVCTHNRQRSLERCLRSIRFQTLLPDHLVIIEKTSKRRTVTKDLLENLRREIQKVSYRKIYEGSISISRNLALKLVNEDIVLFVDDDVVLEQEYIKKLVGLYYIHPKFSSIVGRITETEKGYWQTFNHKLLTADLRNVYKPQKVDIWPGLNLSFRAKIGITFNENYSALEDFDFCMRLRKLGHIIMYFPDLSVSHSYVSNICEFVKKFFGYYQNNLLLLKNDHPDNFMFYISKFDRHSFRSYVRLLKFYINQSNDFRLHLRLPIYYLYACLVFFGVVYRAIYFNKDFDKIQR